MDTADFRPNSRALFTLMCFLGLMCLNTMRINPSIAITAMASSNQHENISQGHNNSSARMCIAHNSPVANETHIQPEFTWSSKTQELLLAAFFIGLPVTQMLGGWLADRFGGKWVVAFGTMGSASMNLVCPIAARMGAYYLFAARCLSGVFEGAVVPAMFTLISKWSTPASRTRVTSTAMAGVPFGSAIGQIASGLICSSPELGWQFSFYILGGASVLWALLWMLTIREQPSENPELIRIINSDLGKVTKQIQLGEKSEKPSIPVRSLVTCLPVIAFIAIRFAIQGWVFGTLLTNLPLFMKHILGFSIRQTGFLASIPFICQVLTTMMTSQVADCLIGRNAFSVSSVRKTMVFLGIVIIVAALVPITYIGCRPYVGLLLLIVAGVGIGVTYPTVFSNAVDLAPRFSGTLMGLSNTIGLSASFISPIVTGHLTEDQSDPHGWRYVFFLASGISMIAAIIFQLFGSGEEQAWAKTRTDDTNEKCANTLCVNGV